MTALWVGNGDSRIHTGLGEDTWYRIRLRFPSGKYFPTTGQWNWLTEWHDDGHTTSYNSNAHSIAMGVYTDYPVVSGAVGTNPQLVLRLMGGNTMSPTTKTLSAGSLAYDHWYEFLIHFVWSSNPSAGLVEWFSDSQLVASTSFPTLYQNPDGTFDHPGFGLYNYRLHDPMHTSEIDFDLAAVGPTRTSVGG
jgi:hypothetical protein